MTSTESGVPSPDVVWTQDNLLRGEVTGSNQYLSHPPDLDKQRQIMYSFIHADPSVLEKNTVVPITEPERDGFLESVRRGEIHPLEQEANWNQWEALGHVPAPASADMFGLRFAHQIIQLEISFLQR